MYPWKRLVRFERIASQSQSMIGESVKAGSLCFILYFLLFSVVVVWQPSPELPRQAIVRGSSYRWLQPSLPGSEHQGLSWYWSLEFCRSLVYRSFHSCFQFNTGNTKSQERRFYWIWNYSNKAERAYAISWLTLVFYKMILLFSNSSILNWQLIVNISHTYLVACKKEINKIVGWRLFL